jgi:hypothetical protein
MAHLEEAPPDPLADRADVPAELGAIVTQALEKDPARRPVTARAYARMLIVASGSV